MRSKRIVVIGASAGGIETLRELVAQLPEGFPAPICVVLHSAPDAPGILDAILSRAGVVPARNARDRERIEPGRIFVAPPDHHLVIEPGIVRVTKGPRENRFRPAIDPLFRSAAQVYGPGAVGVVLSGNLGDGTGGLWTIKRLGGTAIVQDPDDALFPAMPLNALNHVEVDHTVPLAALGRLLVQVTAEAPAGHEDIAIPETLEVDVKIAKEENPIDAGLHDISTPSAFACPECHGVLLQIKEGSRLRFRCHTGHAYSLDSLLAAISEAIEESLWIAIRALEEGHLLMRAVGEHVQTHHDAAAAEAFSSRAAEAKEQSDSLRRLVMTREPVPVKP